MKLKILPKQDRPFLLVWVISFVVFFVISALMGGLKAPSGLEISHPVLGFMVAAYSMVMLSIALSFVSVAILVLLAFIGTSGHRLGKNCYWAIGEYTISGWRCSLSYYTPTYGNVFRWVGTGVRIIFYELCYGIWWRFLRFFYREPY
jgi:uncharacterized membrane protein YhhN